MSLPKYIVNPEELREAVELLGDKLGPNVNVTDSRLVEMLQAQLEEVLKLLDEKEAAKNSAQRFVHLHRHIPAVEGDYELKYIFEEDAQLTGIAYSQSGWKVTDRWSLYAGDELLFRDATTKELGEYKHFNAFYPVAEGTEVRIIYHNNSGNSKQAWFDIGYLGAAPVIEPEEPETPPGESVTIIVYPKEIVEVGYVDIPAGFDGNLVINMSFVSISGADYPDLEVVAPNGDSFGYTRSYNKDGDYQAKTGLSSCSLAVYTGWTTNPEEMTYSSPMQGKWYFYAQSQGGGLESEVTFTCNQLVHVTYNRD